MYTSVLLTSACVCVCVRDILIRSEVSETEIPEHEGTKSQNGTSVTIKILRK